MPHSEYEDLIPVEGHNNLYRDRNNGSIVNFDKNDHNNYQNNEDVLHDFQGAAAAFSGEN